MNFIYKLSFKNIIKRPARSTALLILSAFLAFSAFTGSIVTASLENGLNSIHSRLGADVIIVPTQVANKSDSQMLLVQSKPGYFYMDRSNYTKALEVEGVEAASPQYYLVTLSAGCCSMPVQIIGFEPDTDFSVQPWIKESSGKKPDNDEILVGYNINAYVGSTLSFYNHDCRVVSKLDKTGTELDNAVYANSDTLRTLILAARDMGSSVIAKRDPSEYVSSVLIKVREGYDAEAVADYINVHFRHVTAIKMQNMISGIAQSLSGVTGMIGFLTCFVWVLSFIIMATAFVMSVNERKKEFAVLRVVGASREKLAAIVLCEAAVLGFFGGVAGVAVGCGVIYLFGGLIETSLNLPFLMPNIGYILISSIVALCAAVLAGALASAVSAVRISRIDTGFILREGA